MPIDGGYVVYACAQAINAVWPEYPVYTEYQRQNVKRPSFHVRQLFLGQDRHKAGEVKTVAGESVGDKYTRLYRIKIKWLPPLDSPELKQLCYETGNKLMEVFAKLDLPDLPVFGRGLEFEIVNDELEFTVEYPIWACWVADPGPAMEELSLSETLKD